MRGAHSMYTHKLLREGESAYEYERFVGYVCKCRIYSISVCSSLPLKPLCISSRITFVYQQRPQKEELCDDGLII